MLRIVFWNVGKSDLTEKVCSIAEATDADVVVLNECEVDIGISLAALRDNVSDSFYVPTSIRSDRFHCFSKRQVLDLREVHAGTRTSVRKLNAWSMPTLLVIVHGIDIRNNDPETRQAFAQSLAMDLELVKDKHSTNRLIILGDFNMNPFDRGMTLAPGFNAMMTILCTKRGKRRHYEKEYDIYYNPMWSLFGDRTPGPPGTVYDSSNQGSFGWNMLDQAILSHTMVDYFSDVQILCNAGGLPLVTELGRPDKINASDHLPILLTLREESDVQLLA